MELDLTWSSPQGAVSWQAPGWMMHLRSVE